MVDWPMPKCKTPDKLLIITCLDIKSIPVPNEDHLGTRTQSGGDLFLFTNTSKSFSKPVTFRTGAT
jgi:hypothetical protein